MMMYGTTMSVIVRRMRFAVGVSAEEKYPLMTPNAGMWNA